MDQQQQSQKYSLKWASGIVQDFNRKYVRATDAVKTVYQFTDENVAEWIAKAPGRWQNYKKIVKQLDRWEKHQATLGQSPIVLNRCVVDAVTRVLKYTY